MIWEVDDILILEAPADRMDNCSASTIIEEDGEYTLREGGKGFDLHCFTERNVLLRAPSLDELKKSFKNKYPRGYNYSKY